MNIGASVATPRRGQGPGTRSAEEAAEWAADPAPVCWANQEAAETVHH